MSSTRTLVSSLLSLGAGSGLTYLLIKNNNETKILSPSSTVPGNRSTNTSVTTENTLVSPAEWFKFGFPGPVHDLQRREQFVSCYNRQTRNPYWVVEHFTPESLATKSGNRQGSVFREDEQIPELFRAKLGDYFRSGYDRGHQAPAADSKFSQKAMNDTFYLTNMCPQVGQGFNRDYWAHFEFFCRDLTKQYKSVRVMTGPLYLPKQDPNDGKFRVTYEMIGNPPNVAVPTHFFKLVVAENPIDKKNKQDGKLAIEAFVLPNDQISNDTKLLDFVVPVNALERSTGLNLLQAVNKNSMVPLCKEVNCQIVVRDFSNKMNNNNKQKSLPPKK
ncbi:similar to Saccharomyces cerevisiae YJL208C NUC1 Major mitochondrial nuclease, has RNAse and DNA endo- and exonucleolytic activities [Maudiozyma barnettii]|uniref:Endonuclease n=1 Tax=Maudiozyma barnettii TaxID=61262 RepID=A0A8H2ZIY3_9SACH|nr:ribonuclease [Kazachstania barnettii]CAB4255992.1 similar to Saccharomyces cerevisiae YJL208C NUC1 Major mitochondrial nuclease, has RNAse and DNA endo- and exonucleolytic activities [Kazachstania barnettii]CAD1784600.1 similar to Saccharomyces cerevisiae YJL208C NUC1 Major mitochondrial nuclease, has RNAse and DNA endo- and exonucleolytic activities [Kazachstania barnettii]